MTGAAFTRGEGAGHKARLDYSLRSFFTLAGMYLWSGIPVSASRCCALTCSCTFVPTTVIASNDPNHVDTKMRCAVRLPT